MSELRSFQKAEIQREVDILLSPLDKFEGQEVRISTYNRVWVGVLKAFGGGWLKIETIDGATVIYTGTGMAIELLTSAQRRAKREQEALDNIKPMPLG